MNLLSTLKSVTKSVKSSAIKHLPEIMIIGGVGVGVGATVYACKQTLKLPEILDEDAKAVEVIESQEYENEEEKKKQIRIVKGKTVKKVVKLYTGPVLLGVTSAASILGGTKCFKIRNAKQAQELAVTTAALTGVTQSFNGYKKRVAEVLGEEAEKDIRYGVETKTVEERVTDKKGKEKIVKKEVATARGPIEHSQYTFIFDPTSQMWSKNALINKSNLIDIQAECNLLLKTRGYLFLNEVLQKLDIPVCELGQLAGWLMPDFGGVDGVVDFGMFDPNDESKRRFINGYENCIWLDFNCDGYIADKVHSISGRNK